MTNMVNVLPSEALGQNELFDVFREGRAFNQAANLLEERAEQLTATAVEALGRFTSVPEAIDAGYPHIASLSVAANFDRAQAQQLRDRIKTLDEATKAFFIGRAALVVPLREEIKPITAYYVSGPNHKAKRQQTNLLTKPYPKEASGDISRLSIPEAKVTIKPSRFSPYRFDKGFFEVNTLDEYGDPLVKINFL